MKFSFVCLNKIKIIIIQHICRRKQNQNTFISKKKHRCDYIFIIKCATSTYFPGRAKLIEWKFPCFNTTTQTTTVICLFINLIFINSHEILFHFILFGNQWKYQLLKWVHSSIRQFFGNSKERINEWSDGGILFRYLFGGMNQNYSVKKVSRTRSLQRHNF